MTTYVAELLESIINSFGLSNHVATRVEGSPIRIGLDIGTPLALLAAEVITNACKHAFPRESKGEIAVTVEEHDGKVRMRVSDNGIGLVTNPDRPSANEQDGTTPHRQIC